MKSDNCIVSMFWLSYGLQDLSKHLMFCYLIIHRHPFSLNSSPLKWPQWVFRPWERSATRNKYLPTCCPAIFNDWSHYTLWVNIWFTWMIIIVSSQCCFYQLENPRIMPTVIQLFCNLWRSYVVLSYGFLVFF